MTDNVHHPKHYTQGKVEIIDVIEQLIRDYPPVIGWSIGQAVKYIARGPYKGAMEEDLNKAKWYLDRAVLVVGREEAKVLSDSNGST